MPGSTPSGSWPRRASLVSTITPTAKGGEFYGPLFVNNGPPVRKPILRQFDMQSAIRNLWEVSARETGVELASAPL